VNTGPLDDLSPALIAARDLIGIGRHDDARRLIADVLAARPDSADALATLAYLHHATGDAAAMLEAADRAVAAAPAHPWAHRLRAIGLLGEGRVAEAVRAARRCVELDPHGAPAHQVWAHALMRHGDLVAAYQAAVRAVELAPEDADSYSTLARVLRVAGERSAARAADRAALRLAPGAAEPYRALAESATMAGRYRAAARTYRSLLRTHPTEAGLPRAFEAALDWLQALWAGLAAVVAGAALVLYLTGTPALPRAAATATLGIAWAVAYGCAHRGLAGAWWRYLRTREGTRREPRAAVVALLVPLAVAGLFGFGPLGMPWLVVVPALVFYAIALMMPVGFLVVHLTLAAAARRRRRQFRRDLGNLGLVSEHQISKIAQRPTRA
jgi:tetratricopeptide (TPR) repeat protein